MYLDYSKNKWEEESTYDFKSSIEDGKIMISDVRIHSIYKKYYKTSPPLSPARGGVRSTSYLGNNQEHEFFFKGKIGEIQIGWSNKGDFCKKKGLVKIFNTTELYKNFKEHESFKQETLSESYSDKFSIGGVHKIISKYFTSEIPIQDLLKIDHSINDSPFILAENLNKLEKLTILSPLSTADKIDTLKAMNDDKLPKAINIADNWNDLYCYSHGDKKYLEQEMMAAYIAINGWT